MYKHALYIHLVVAYWTCFIHNVAYALCTLTGIHIFTFYLINSIYVPNTLISHMTCNDCAYFITSLNNTPPCTWSRKDFSSFTTGDELIPPGPKWQLPRSYPAVRKSLSTFCRRIWRCWTSKMFVRYILSSLCVKLCQLSQLSFTPYMGLRLFSLPIYLVMILIICLINLISITESEVGSSLHCFALGHETIVCALWHFMFFFIREKKWSECRD